MESRTLSSSSLSLLTGPDGYMYICRVLYIQYIHTYIDTKVDDDAMGVGRYGNNNRE